jgi:hypothetical protein
VTGAGVTARHDHAWSAAAGFRDEADRRQRGKRRLFVRKRREGGGKAGHRSAIRRNRLPYATASSPADMFRHRKQHLNP